LIYVEQSMHPSRLCFGGLSLFARCTYLNERVVPGSLKRLALGNIVCDLGGGLVNHKGSTVLVGLALNCGIQEGLRGLGGALLGQKRLNILKIAGISGQFLSLLFAIDGAERRLESFLSKLFLFSVVPKVCLPLDPAGTP